MSAGFRGEDYPGLSEPSVTTLVLPRTGNRRENLRDCGGKSRPDAAGSGSGDEGRGCELRNVGDLEVGRGQDAHAFLELLKRKAALFKLDFSPVRPSFDF